MSLFIAVLLLFINAFFMVNVCISEIIKYIHKDKTVKNEDASLPNNEQLDSVVALSQNICVKRFYLLRILPQYTFRGSK